MVIRLLTGHDLAAVRAYLDCNDKETVQVAGNIAKWGIDNNKSSRRSGDYYGYFADGSLAGLLVCYNLGSVLLHSETTAAMAPFAEVLAQRRFEVLAGLTKTIRPLCRLLETDKQVLGYEDSFLLENHEPQPVVLPASCRIAGIEAVARQTALTFIVEAYRQGFGRRFNHEMAGKLLDERGGDEPFLFVLEQGFPQAQAIMQVSAGRVSQIGGVYTAPASRGKRYCQAVVAELCRQSLAAGRTPTLMVRQGNQAAIRAYQAIGFTYQEDYLVVKFKV